jgi:hypothetical protein
LKKNNCLRSSCDINDIDSCIAVRMYSVAVISLMQCKKVVIKCILLHIMNQHSHDFKSGGGGTELHGFNQR